MYKKVGGFALPMSDNHNKGVRRQEHDSLYVRNGAILPHSRRIFN